jgi:predicted nucleic acid-binding protein
MSHGLGIPAVDSVILAGMLDAKCEIIYTTDSHFETVVKKGVSIMNLGKSH